MDYTSEDHTLKKSWTWGFSEKASENTSRAVQSFFTHNSRSDSEDVISNKNALILSTQQSKQVSSGKAQKRNNAEILLRLLTDTDTDTLNASVSLELHKILLNSHIGLDQDWLLDQPTYKNYLKQNPDIMTAYTEHLEKEIPKIGYKTTDAFKNIADFLKTLKKLNTICATPEEINLRLKNPLTKLTAQYKLALKKETRYIVSAIRAYNYKLNNHISQYGATQHCEPTGLEDKTLGAINKIFNQLHDLGLPPNNLFALLFETYNTNQPKQIRHQSLIIKIIEQYKKKFTGDENFYTSLITYLKANQITLDVILLQKNHANDHYVYPSFFANLAITNVTDEDFKQIHCSDPSWIAELNKYTSLRNKYLTYIEQEIKETSVLSEQQIAALSKYASLRDKYLDHLTEAKETSVLTELEQTHSKENRELFALIIINSIRDATSKELNFLQGKDLVTYYNNLLSWYYQLF